MRHLSLAAALGALGLPAVATAGSVAFVPLQSADPKAAANVSSVLGSELSFMPNFEEVIEVGKAPTTLTYTCLSSSTCLGGIARSAGGDAMITGILTNKGTEYALDLVYFDTKLSKVIKRKQFILPADSEAVADGMNKLVKDLIGAGAPPAAAAPTLAAKPKEESFEFEEDAPAKPATKPPVAPAKPTAAVPAAKPAPTASKPIPTPTKPSSDDDDFAFEDEPAPKPAAKPAATPTKPTATATAKPTPPAPTKPTAAPTAAAPAKPAAKPVTSLDDDEFEFEEEDPAVAAKAAADAKAKADADAKARVAAEAKAKADATRLAAEAEAKRKADEQARLAAAAKAKADEEARLAAAAKAKAEADAKARADAQARAAADAKAAADARARAVAAAKPAEDFDPNAISFGSAAGEISDAQINDEISFGAPDDYQPAAAPKAVVTPKPAAKPAPAKPDPFADLDEPSFDDEEEEIVDLDAPAPKPSAARAAAPTPPPVRTAVAPPAKPAPKPTEAPRGVERPVREPTVTLDRDDDVASSRVQIALRGGWSQYYAFGFVTAGGEVAVGLADTVYLVGGIDAWVVRRNLPPALQIDGQTTQWQTIAPLNFGVVYKAPGKVRPYIGADAILANYYVDANGKMNLAVGGRARVGVDVMMTDNFGLTLNGSAGFWQGGQWQTVQADVKNQGLLPQVSAGTVFAF